MSLPALHVDGLNLKETGGAVAKLGGMDAFALFKRWCMTDGPNALVKPILDDWDNVLSIAGYTGKKALRVFRCAAPPNAFALDPWSYPMAKVTEFTQYCEGRGYYVDWTAGDYQLCFPSADGNRGELNGPHGIREHNNQFCAALVGCGNAIWNGCNEPFKNGVNVADIVPPPWAPVVQYSGEYGDGHDASLDWAAVNLHTDRSDENGVPKWVGKAHESAPYMWARGKAVIYDEGMGADEVNKPGSRSNVPAYFRVLGSVITMVSAVYFHCTDGMECTLLRPVQKNCAIEFFKGVKGGLL